MSVISETMTIVGKLNQLIDELAAGIEESDWERIRYVYEEVTGEEAPEVEKQPVSEIDSSVVQALIKRIENLEKPKKPTRKRKTTVKKKEEPKTNSNNKFEEMQLSLESELTPAERKQLESINDEVPPTPRTRPAFKKVSVECRLCNKTYEVHPSLKRESYVCDKCVSRRAR